MRSAFGAVLGLLLLSGCSDLEFRQARHLEDTRQFARAAASYERFLERGAGGPRETEALVRLGRIYADAFGRCERAVPLFERAARSKSAASGMDWPSAARTALLACPDFFPLREGSRWVYVDSQSGGRNMRLEFTLSRSSAAVTAAGAYFAGVKRFRDYRRSYEQEGWILYEKDASGDRAPILRYPYREGLSWQARRGGRLFTYRIVSAGVPVSVKAGAFRDCIKVRSEAAGDPAWVFDYYCPGVGRAKTTVGVNEGENPNTELAEHSFAGSSTPSSSK